MLQSSSLHHLVVPAVPDYASAAAGHEGVVLVELGLHDVVSHHHVGRVVQGQTSVGLAGLRRRLRNLLQNKLWVHKCQALLRNHLIF